ncbi:ArsA family ATPase [Pseudidiomarina woesei]|uniref:arsenite-transporting ATPase n=1 Tax=Pseudidiomarina woesei TaxID=1381080 RepID=A0A0K6GV78_9GAMM|nr:ArsA family ATPase [Pseudidiomarina woesei]CUA82656.1 arsenite efflux ATP-binding protein ArsA (TC 3.A.4.1.1) [Pseudidiomarina woesei]
MFSVDDKQIVFVGGKGGVGKTTISSALALQQAKHGRKVLLISTDPAHSLADAFDKPIGDTITSMTERVDALEIDPDAEVEAHITRVMKTMKRFSKPDMYPEIERQMRLTQQSPGAQEAALLERIARLIDEKPADYDLIIFDTAPTGHTLRLLTLPEAMAAWTQGLLKQTERSKKLEGVLEHLSPKAGKDITNPMADPKQHESAELDERTAEISETLLRRQRLFHRTRHVLTDPSKTALIFVLTPEKLPILETARAVTALRQEKLPIAGLVINRNLPDHADGEFFAKRRAQEAQYRNEIEHEFQDLQRVYLPLFPTDLHGLDALKDIAEQLP